METRNKIMKFKDIYINKTFLLCFIIAWMITNGWAYLGAFLGTVLHIRLLAFLSSLYLSFLWLPFTPEKILTLFLADQIRKYIFHI
ncbi:MAG: hypothetical protein II153_04615 [Erysipelotrichaceae bacterium]|nr:hypothetical protein [Erysipelotrichaceae bacterium]